MELPVGMGGVVGLHHGTSFASLIRPRYRVSAGCEERVDACMSVHVYVCTCVDAWMHERMPHAHIQNRIKRIKVESGDTEILRWDVSGNLRHRRFRVQAGVAMQHGRRGKRRKRTPPEMRPALMAQIKM